MWFRKKKQETISNENIPKHIAFIADGNGRWATERGLPRCEGHKNGKDAIKKVIDRCFERNIQIVSIFCFSTENFKRPKPEVDYIFDLFVKMKDNLKESLLKRDARLHLVGDEALLPKEVQVAFKEIVEATKDCKSHVLNLCLAYGSRHEIVNAINKLVEKGIKVDEETFSSYLDTAGLADPDLIVRASGEQRLSNFMLWQSAYAEFYFPKKYWPDFDAKTVDECISVYQKRKRRFGKI